MSLTAFSVADYMNTRRTLYKIDDDVSESSEIDKKNNTTTETENETFLEEDDEEEVAEGGEDDEDDDEVAALKTLYSFRRAPNSGGSSSNTQNNNANANHNNNTSTNAGAVGKSNNNNNNSSNFLTGTSMWSSSSSNNNNTSGISGSFVGMMDDNSTRSGFSRLFSLSVVGGTDNDEAGMKDIEDPDKFWDPIKHQANKDAVDTTTPEEMSANLVDKISVASSTIPKDRSMDMTQRLQKLERLYSAAIRNMDIDTSMNDSKFTTTSAGAAEDSKLNNNSQEDTKINNNNDYDVVDPSSGIEIQAPNSAFTFDEYSTARDSMLYSERTFNTRDLNSATFSNVDTYEKDTVDDQDTYYPGTYDGTFYNGSTYTNDENDSIIYNNTKQANNSNDSNNILCKLPEVPEMCVGPSVLSNIREEASGMYEDTAITIQQIFNVFTLQPEDIRSVTGRINRAKKEFVWQYLYTKLKSNNR